MKAKAPKSVRLKFASHIKKQNLTLDAVSKLTEISITQLHFILNGTRPLTEDNRKELNQKLNTNY